MRKHMLLLSTLLLVAAIAGVAVLSLGASGALDNPKPPAKVDVSDIAACPSEAGPDHGNPVPCVWDAETQGNGQHGVGTARYYYFSESNDCPPFWQVDVECVILDAWNG